MNTRAFFLVGLLLAPAVATAQSATYEQRGYVEVNLGAQSGSHLITTSSTFTIYDEPGSIDASQSYGGGAVWGLGGGARVWRNLVLGLTYTRHNDEIETAAIARVPHPLFLNRYREANQRIEDLKHTENQYHLTATWMIPFGENMVLGVGGGPSFINFAHEFPSSARIQEVDGPPNFATVAIQDVTFTRGRTTATTFNIGANLTYNLPFDLGEAGKLGATVGFRYAGGETDVDGPSGPIDVKYGGAQFFGGVRVSF